ncbi:MAG: lysophospholipid acyltransferase family protein [Myxococcota bacterium]|nr:lysophospholipid acyltransferase family protein [Myxococcota bacterium]
MPNRLSLLDSLLIDEELRGVLDRLPNRLNEFGYDPWGLNPKVMVRTLAVTRWLYRNYFRASAHGLENIPEGRVLLIANHGGQLPMDGLVIGTAAILEGNPPRILRAMVERWVPTLPFLSTLFTRCGQVVGNREDCRKLLENDEAVLVFPEGARGSGKTIWRRYELQPFGLGFMRLALATGTPIVPVGVVGAEESIPSIYDFKSLARLFGAPYAPVPATLPLLGPLAMLPLPTKFVLNFGEPLYFDGDPDATNAEVSDKVDQVMTRVGELIERGRQQRQSIFEGLLQ